MVVGCFVGVGGIMDSPVGRLWKDPIGDPESSLAAKLPRRERLPLLKLLPKIVVVLPKTFAAGVVVLILKGVEGVPKE